MRLIRAATLTVSDLETSKSLYCDWLEYKCVEQGFIPEGLAASWGTPKTTGQAFAILQPASNAEVYIRLIEQPTVPDYEALLTYGWAAIEICNQNTLKVNSRMERSPFEIIGSPKELEGLPAIFPMQVKGPDKEIVYLTEIRDDPTIDYLPRAESLIDKLFILVMACSNIDTTAAWFKKRLLIEKAETMEIVYSMINSAFNLPSDTKHALATLRHEGDVFLEIDAYPKETSIRSSHDGMLAPFAAIGSFMHPEFEKLMDINKGHWITPPTQQEGVIYKGKRAGSLRDPGGTLIEIIEL